MVKEIADGIVLNPDVKFGKPIIKGTRVPVDLVVGKIAGGMTFEEIMTEYDLTKDQILAALRYAASLVAEEKLAYV
ncbi:hypothetical protein A3G55_01725 [Candidatus Giovannonibacteria bacterium RIFCSPLOWO2_12_FULL_44_25]|uniref:DUF433 domain-containing protein n=3 Tax=Parcubacteria group TaxID=1794811 RepID=A0A837IKW2_9BACT|nr:MAG: hypothetical protein UW15_C0004G0030 [Parcubacteria group bacterium GW2011_GWC1_44_10]KKT60165.1 MAG: hypothetical protein UW53_C0003G0076 [Candidatus Giovannonibacteria bacterium GW2011_GWA1_44_25]KKU12372.1 MAG: hypothetical protein UX18_C0025G0006 [Candidatus Azambacteria bacterium GW2011_GWC2_45_7b]KKU30012.1 MAG: hypothetical protein UX43_C0003G0105 [Candidatus Giovannonibacteria bacterium GW2011_GWB1_46_20]OGF49369.1 MAG: hypothetical protein A2120_03560 [Candidatus Giovannonibact